MRYAFAFGVLGLASAAGATIVPWPMAPLCAWVAVSFGLVSAAYAGLGPAVLGKGDDGELRWWSVLVNAPFLLLGLGSMRLVHATLREEPWNEVAPGIFLGRRPTRLDTARFRAQNVGAILDLCAELPATRARTGRERYRSLPVLDMASPTPEQLADAISWIDTQRARGPVYIHCALGRSRSATVVAAWRMAHGLGDPEQVEASLRDARQVVDLTAAQRAALDQFRVLLAR